MVKPLHEGTLDDVDGIVTYQPEFRYAENETQSVSFAHQSNSRERCIPFLRSPSLWSTLAEEGGLVPQFS